MTAAQQAPDDWNPHLPTLIAIAVVAFATANLAHEALGHGGACLLAGGRPVTLTSVYFECDDAAMTAGGRLLLEAGGSLMNLLFGALALLGLARSRRPTHFRFFLWLLAVVNFFQPAGYLLFAGLGNVGDWAEVIRGLHPALAWRAGMAALGAMAYLGIARAAAGGLASFLGNERRAERARRLAVPSYWAGGLLYCVSGLLNPLGPLLLFISAAAASFGGASGLLWFHGYLRSAGIPLSPEPAVQLDRRPGWLVAGSLAAVLFIALGRGVRF